MSWWLTGTVHFLKDKLKHMVFIEWMIMWALVSAVLLFAKDQGLC